MAHYQQFLRVVNQCPTKEAKEAFEQRAIEAGKVLPPNTEYRYKDNEFMALLSEISSEEPEMFKAIQKSNAKRRGHDKGGNKKAQ